MLKKWNFLLLCLTVIFGLTACTAQSGNSAADTDKIKVTVSFNALKELTEAIGKDKVEVTTIIPDGTEAHDFEPKAQDLVALSKAQVFVYNGLGMESWAEEAASASDNKDLIVVVASDGVDPIVREDAEEDEHEDEEEEEHGKYDPHTWLSITAVQTEVKNIADALVKADPDNKDFYEENCADYTAQLNELFTEYSQKFQAISKKNFVTGHAAFGYLCRDFGLTQNSVSDVFAEGEPSAQQLTKLVEYCRDNNVTTIFAEEMASPAVSETLANEVGAKVETIYTMEGAEDDKTYLERMEENLSKIYDSLS